TRRALLTMSGSVASASARTVHLVMGWNNACWSMYALPGRHMPATAASEVKTTRALAELNASYMPRARCAAPGPEARQMPGLPLVLPYAVAISAAPFSSRTVTMCIPRRIAARVKGAWEPTEIPKMYSTPAAFNVRARASPPVIFAIVDPPLTAACAGVPHGLFCPLSRWERVRVRVPQGFAPPCSDPLAPLCGRREGPVARRRRSRGERSDLHPPPSPGGRGGYGAFPKLCFLHRPGGNTVGAIEEVGIVRRPAGDEEEILLWAFQSRNGRFR